MGQMKELQIEMMNLGLNWEEFLDLACRKTEWGRLFV
jgi:hypothetical protein